MVLRLILLILSVFAKLEILATVAMGKIRMSRYRKGVAHAQNDLETSERVRRERVRWIQSPSQFHALMTVVENKTMRCIASKGKPRPVRFSRVTVLEAQGL
jgi:hypothetical protein